ncbi:unnamed protein product [Linum trigynum]|uniref:Uncharacterized protein n=1 Tax=Linum trigynum TaxID=586398 RepID=A0AAV2CNG6_9ROSI
MSASLAADLDSFQHGYDQSFMKESLGAGGDRPPTPKSHVESDSLPRTQAGWLAVAGFFFLSFWIVIPLVDSSCHLRLMMKFLKTHSFSAIAIIIISTGLKIPFHPLNYLTIYLPFFSLPFITQDKVLDMLSDHIAFNFGSGVFQVASTYNSKESFVREVT